MFPCKKCNKVFSREGHLRDHLLRKKPCVLEKENEIIDDKVVTIVDVSSNVCSYCNRKFFNKYNVIKHIESSCKVKKDKDTEKLNESIMLNKVKEMFESHLKNNNITNITNITNNNITNNIQVNIFSAGKEDLSRLTQEEILKICTSGTYYPIVAAEIIHCNEKYPEFQNFLISNLRSNTGLVFINDNWVSKTQDEILSNIMQIDKKHVSNLIKDLKVDDKLQVKLESTKEEITNGESKEHQKPKIKSRLYNASKMVNKNKKNLEKIIEE
jgi:hypothetical protein